MMNDDTPDLSYYEGEYPTEAMKQKEIQVMYKEHQVELNKVHGELLKASTGDQQLTEKFEQLLKYADRLFTLVLVFGDDELFATVSDKINKTFTPHDSCINPPVVKRIPLEKVENLKKCTWSNTKEIDKKVKKHIENTNAKSFVFYRHGSYSNLRELAEEAVDEICKICMDKYLLVVGNDYQIEDYIQDDIQIVAFLAGLDKEKFENLCKDLQKAGDPCTITGTDAIFTLLVLPCVDQLKKELKEELQCPYKTLTVIYSGHGNPPDGSWVLYDDSFCASDLMEVLHSIPKLQHDFKLRIYLNCCYGLAFAKQISNTDLLFAAFDVNFKDIKSDNFPSELKNDSLEKIIHIACSNDDTELRSKVNGCITKLMIRLWKTVKDFIQLDIEDKKLSGFILPFAFGPLDAKGVLKQLTYQAEKYQISDSIKIRALFKQLDDRLYGEGIDEKPIYPQLIVFPAKHGDSTLFRWHKFNMLVDGGPSMSPCFWETVRRLPKDQKLDILVVTHYDFDHIGGILRLFKKELPIINVGTLYTVHPTEVTATARHAKHGRDLVTEAKLAITSNRLKKVLDLETNCVEPIFSKGASATGDKLYIYMVTPTKENLHKARQDMSRRLSPANIGSASLLIKCYIGTSKEYRYALLTGDAPPQAILDGLDKLKKHHILEGTVYENNHYSFDYVDMPHHGACAHTENPDSKDNNPKLFLSHIHTKACVVSTNGKQHYGHPQDESLRILNKSLINNAIRKLFFTYCKRNKEDIRLKVAHNTEQQAKCIFAKNDPSNSQATKCLLFNLSAHTYGEYDTSNVTVAQRHGRYDE